MADSSKRSLRERKAPKVFGSDVEEQDPYGYAKPSYPRPQPQHEHRNNPQQSVSDARLLVSFLSSVNKRLRQYTAVHAKTQSPPSKQPLPLPNNKNRAIEPPRDLPRRQNEGKEPKIQVSRRSKDDDVKREINARSESGTKGGLVLSQFQAINAESANKMLSLENSIRNRQPSGNSSQARLQKIKVNHAQQAPTKKPTISPMNRISPSPSIRNGSSFKETKENTNEANGRKDDNKIFKRASYHVAIAYHIFLKRMSEKGSKNIDPTSSARRLKEGLK